MTQQPIVVILDDSEADQPALDWAANQAEISSCSVYIVGPYSPLAQPEHYWAPVMRENDRRRHEANRNVSLSLRWAGQNFPSLSILGSPMAGPLSMVVADLSAVAGLIVLATGSAVDAGASYRLATEAQCPVVLVPARPLGSLDRARQPVALLVEDAVAAVPAMKFAIARASEWAVDVVVVGVTPLVAAEPGDQGAGPVTPESARRQIEKQLRSLGQTTADVQVSYEQPADSSPAGVLHGARSAQLVVLGGAPVAEDLDHGELVDCALQQALCVAVVPATGPDRGRRTQQPLQTPAFAQRGTLAPT